MIRRHHENDRRGRVWLGVPGPPTDLVVLGCVAGKRSFDPLEARDQYQSPLWARRRAYAEATGLPWLIYSARFGLIEPRRVIPWYNEPAGRHPKRAIMRKHAQVAASVIARWGDSGTVVELHMGEPYFRDLFKELRARKLRPCVPTGGLGIGEQLQWYDAQLALDREARQRELP